MNAAHSAKTANSELDDNQTGVVVSINISPGGVPKRRVTGATVFRNGLQNDDHDDKKHHGGPERAVCVYALDRIRALQDEGHPIDIGTAGENLTVDGLDWERVTPGIHLRVGSRVLLEVSSFTSPCKTIRASFVDGKFSRISQVVHPGWSRVYSRVISEGEIHVGDAVELLPAQSR
jgi:MOSC domain-containing protein YiiM